MQGPRPGVRVRVKIRGRVRVRARVRVRGRVKVRVRGRATHLIGRAVTGRVCACREVAGAEARG